MSPRLFVTELLAFDRAGSGIAREIFAGNTLADLLAFDRATPAGIAHELLAFDRSSSRTYDVDGRLHVEVCNLSKATVNPYYGREIPNAMELGLEPEKIYRLYRDPVELEKGAASFNNLQLLDLHTPVDVDNPKMDRTCGCIGSDVRFEEPYLKASLAVWTAEAIALVQSKKAAQLSCSYRYKADMTPGVTSGGLAYDGVMRDIAANHVALVSEGRAGPDVCVNDSLPVGLSTMKFPKLVSLISSIVAMTGPQRLALDAALDAKAKDAEMPDAAEDAYEREEACDEREAACDAREQSMDEAEKNPDTEVARGDRKKARDARKGARDARAKDRKIAKDKAKDAEPMLKKEGAEDVAAAVDAAIKAGGFVTQAEAQRLAADAVARVEGIAQAKRDVAPLVGEIAVAMDSADSIYRFALDQVKVEHKGIHASALPAVVAAEVRVRKGAPRPANDGVSLAAGGFSIEQIFAAPQA